MEERDKILSSIRNPLSMIALFVLSVEITVSFAMTSSNLTEVQRWFFVVFCTAFPLIVFVVFSLFAWYRPVHLYGPQDYSDSRLYLQAMKKGKIEDEVEEIVQSDEGQTTESRMQAAGWLANAESLAIGNLLKEFNCPISQQVLSENRSYLFDAVIHKGRRWIYVDVKYLRIPSFNSRFLDQIRKFAQAAEDNLKILAIVTPETMDESRRAKFRSKIAEIDKNIDLRFYKL